MKCYLFLFLFLCSWNVGFCQKPPLTISAIKNWECTGGAALSDDGYFAWYGISDSKEEDDSLVLESTDLRWKLNIPGSESAVFSQDSKSAIFLTSKDSLGILTLGQNDIQYKPFVRSFKVAPCSRQGWVAYMSDTAEGELTVARLPAGRGKRFHFVKDYEFSRGGNLLILFGLPNVDQDNSVTISIHDLVSDKTDTIWKGTGMEKVIFDKAFSQFALMTVDTIDGRKHKTLCFGMVGGAKRMIVSESAYADVGDSLQLDDIWRFSNDGKRVFVHLCERDARQPPRNGTKVDIWNYKDAKLQSQQLRESNPKKYLAIFDIDKRLVIKLQNKNERIFAPFSNESVESNDKLVLVRGLNEDADEGETWWNPAIKTSIFVESTENGSRQAVCVLGSGPTSFTQFHLSPTGKYVIYFDILQKSYYSYEVSSGRVKNISKKVPTNWTSEEDIPKAAYFSMPIAGWMRNDSALLVYDRNDIWQLDPGGHIAPINITNGFGHAHHVVFRLALQDYYKRSLNPGESLVLTAFNTETKENGFYEKELGSKLDPLLLTMGAYMFYLPEYFINSPPEKAKNASIWVLQRESATESPNYFCTRDFKSFTRLSDLHPERSYNWLTTDLITWRQNDGQINHGVLYKPENFDPSRKYPLIITYYEQWSYKLNEFDEPNLAMDRINISYFVSNGYLVFAPDIHYKIGQPGVSALNSVLSGLEVLRKYPWIDIKRMGLQGHSFGGYETNYIVSHTHLFAAAMSASSVSDLIPNYNSVFSDDGNSYQSYYELDQGRMGIPPWKNPDLYVRNSPIYCADRITTPLLLMNNKEDAAVPFTQGIELFTALRRLGKKVWLLQYDNETHSLFNDSSKEDYTIRMKQFFDHYLRHAVAPIWMTKGVKASMKGIDSGLELDFDTGSRP